ncbi:Trm112 family protein [Gammaproteobacteria bacterium]|nr:Trm112 family protein [Gammaproteobacteria bacterium]MDC1251273.1 Trm112 family protein [Gammaproteobacteria bacterium]
MNKIDKKLLDILVCPVSKGPLEQIDDELVCQTSKLAYPIKDGIPVMLPEEARNLSDEL